MKRKQKKHTVQKNTPKEVEKDLRPRCNATIDEVPEWQRYNKWILSFYRINYVGTKSIASTFVKCHNETVNVWTHFLGLCSLVVVVFYVISQHHYQYYGNDALTIS